MILFRCDGNNIIGMGHVMRCIAIAKVLKESGRKIHFVFADDTLSMLMEELDFEYSVLQSKYQDMQSEKSSFEKILEEIKPKIIIVDSYYVTFSYLFWLKKYGKTVYIDDRASFAYPVDVLVNYNIFAYKINYQKIYAEANIEEPKLLLGTKYILLRKEFQNIPKKSIPQFVSKVLVSTGGCGF